MKIEIVQDFRERWIDNAWIEDFDAFCRRQWADFDYKYADGESLREVQLRNVAALQGVLQRYMDRNIVVGSHGTALSTIINHYDKSFGYDAFEQIKKRMPWVVRFVFEGAQCIQIQPYDLFAGADANG